MESITVYPENERQKSLIALILEEMKVRFELVEEDGQTQMSEQDFFAKIDKSIEQAEAGNLIVISKRKQKELLGL